MMGPGMMMGTPITKQSDVIIRYKKQVLYIRNILDSIFVKINFQAFY
ncbi:hypothetical protein NMT12_220001 [metagenome]